MNDLARSRIFSWALLVSMLVSALGVPNQQVLASPANANQDTQAGAALRSSASVVGDGTPVSCSEAALESALSAGGSITFNCGGPATILLTSTKQISLNTQIDGGGSVTISGGDAVRLFTVATATVVALSHLTLTQGFVSGENGGAILLDSGATLTISNATLTGNRTVGGYGGAVYVGAATLTVADSTFSNNDADVEGMGDYSLGGGAIQNNDGTVTVSGSTFVGNSVTSHTGDGGAIYSGDYDAGPNQPDTLPETLTITNSTFYDNHLLNESALPSAGNSAGAVRSASAVTIIHSTFSNNDSGTTENGGEAGAVTITHGTATLINTIFANSTGADCARRSAVTGLTGSGNIIENNHGLGFGCGTPALTADPALGVLQNNGGPTETMAPGAGSPALDALTNCSAAMDQRGVARPQGASCDIGAYEKVPSFADVPFSYWASSYIERLYNAGITGGCATNPLKYCPEISVNRAQMAVFLLRGIHGSSYSPPAVGGSTGFSDVPADYWAAAWIKQLAAEGITGGCGSGKYCPEYPVTRDQMAVFLLRSEHGAAYSPPAVVGGTGFNDVPSNQWAAAWIKQLVTEGITAGCGGGNYCPGLPVTRAQMAVFLVRTFQLP